MNKPLIMRISLDGRHRADVMSRETRASGINRRAGHSFVVPVTISLKSTWPASLESALSASQATRRALS